MAKYKKIGNGYHMIMPKGFVPGPSDEVIVEGKSAPREPADALDPGPPPIRVPHPDPFHRVPDVPEKEG